MSSLQKVSEKVLSGSSDKVVSLHEVRSNWILQLDNTVLRKMVTNYAPHVRPGSSDIDAINKAHTVLVSHREFLKQLHRAGFFLSNKQAKCVNEENRQIFYRRRIENKVLRDLLSHHRLHIHRWQVITRNQIDTLNNLLRRPLLPDALGAALERLRIILDEKQLQAIIKESQSNSEASLYVSARNTYEALQHALLNMDLKNIKQQFSGYLSLILNESALSANEVDALRDELTYILVRKAVPTRVENPFISVIKSIQLKADQLREKRMLLSQEHESISTTQLINRIDKLLLRISKYSYKLLFRQQIALAKWANRHKISDALHSEIQQLAPRCVLQRSEARELLHKLHVKSLRQISV